jgi:hypothetical protein
MRTVKSPPRTVSVARLSRLTARDSPKIMKIAIPKAAT